MLDRWQKRQVEQKLARELAEAREDLRLAHQKPQEIVDSGVPPSDSLSLFHRARARLVAARIRHKIALDRWVDFVIYGKIPGD